MTRLLALALTACCIETAGLEGISGYEATVEAGEDREPLLPGERYELAGWTCIPEPPIARPEGGIGIVVVCRRDGIRIDPSTYCDPGQPETEAFVLFKGDPDETLRLRCWPR